MPIVHKPKGPGGGEFQAGAHASKTTTSAKGAQVDSAKSKRAKAAHSLVDKAIQRYAEEHNEPKLAKALGGLSYRDNEPVDIVVGTEGRVQHGIELKTVVSNKAGKITMKGEALARKRTWARKNKAVFHTVVFDDSRVYNAKGAGLHDESQRAILYRRGAGSFRLAKMYRCRDVTELKKLLDTPTKQLPAGAK